MDYYPLLRLVRQDTGPHLGIPVHVTLVWSYSDVGPRLKSIVTLTHHSWYCSFVNNVMTDRVSLTSHRVICHRCTMIREQFISPRKVPRPSSFAELHTMIRRSKVFGYTRLGTLSIEKKNFFARNRTKQITTILS